MGTTDTSPEGVQKLIKGLEKDLSTNPGGRLVDARAHVIRGSIAALKQLSDERDAAWRENIRHETAAKILKNKLTHTNKQIAEEATAKQAILEIRGREKFLEDTRKTEIEPLLAQTSLRPGCVSHSHALYEIRATVGSEIRLELSD